MATATKIGSVSFLAIFFAIVLLKGYLYTPLVGTSSFITIFFNTQNLHILSITVLYFSVINALLGLYLLTQFILNPPFKCKFRTSILIISGFFVCLLLPLLINNQPIADYSGKEWICFYYTDYLLLPVFFSLAVLLFGRVLGIFGAFTIVTCAALVTACFSWLTLLYINPVTDITFFSESTWQSFNKATYWLYLHHNWSLTFDVLSISMWCLVTFVSAVVVFFSFNYMLTDPHLVRFLAYLVLFTFFMLLLVCSDSFVLFFFAWEGVGICSYLLIGFWSTRLQAVKSAIKAVLINKIGDIFLLFAFSLLWNHVGIWCFSQVNAKTILLLLKDYTYVSVALFDTINVVSLCFILAAVGKSAQLGLHTWLPDAMEGPTPVSALIHAATMVTAGIFLILRISSLLTCSSTVLTLVTTIGALTALVSGVIACYQIDIKKIIAYSTCSQLGYMFFACGLSLFSASLFHLLSHGFFKALLFLIAGSLIHLYRGEQLVSKLSIFENRQLAHLYSIALYVGLTALSALPFFSGFYSKEPILLQSGVSFFDNIWVSEAVGYNVGLVAGVLTATYSAFLFADLLQKTPKTRRAATTHPFININTYMALGTLLLASIFIGYYFSVFFEVMFYDFFKDSYVYNFISTKPLVFSKIFIFEKMPALPAFWELLPLLATLLFASTPISLKKSTPWKKFHTGSLALSIMPINKESNNLAGWFFKTIQNKFWFDYLYNSFSRSLLRTSYTILFKKLDKGLLEFIGPLSSTSVTIRISRKLLTLQRNVVFEGFFFLSTFLILNLFFF